MFSWLVLFFLILYNVRSPSYLFVSTHRLGQHFTSPRKTHARKRSCWKRPQWSWKVCQFCLTVRMCPIAPLCSIFALLDIPSGQSLHVLAEGPYPHHFWPFPQVHGSNGSPTISVLGSRLSLCTSSWYCVDFLTVSNATPNISPLVNRCPKRCVCVISHSCCNYSDAYPRPLMSLSTCLQPMPHFRLKVVWWQTLGYFGTEQLWFHFIKLISIEHASSISSYQNQTGFSSPLPSDNTASGSLTTMRQPSVTKCTEAQRLVSSMNAAWKTTPSWFRSRKYVPLIWKARQSCRSSAILFAKCWWTFPSYPL